MSSGLQYGCSKRARCSGRALSLTSSFLLRFAGVFCGALGRTRTCDLLIRSHSLSETGRDSGGQGETKQRFYQVLALLEGHRGTGRDTRLRSDCGQKARAHYRDGLGLLSDDLGI